MNKERTIYILIIAFLLSFCFTVACSALFSGADEPADGRFDLNNDGAVTIKDAHFLLNYLKNGALPVPEPKTSQEILDAAYALQPHQSFDKAYTLTGKVGAVTLPSGAKDGTVSFELIVENREDQPIYVYRATGTGIEKLRRGDTVTVTCVLRNYMDRDGSFAVETAPGATVDKIVRAQGGDGITENAEYETLHEAAERIGATYGIPSEGDVEILVIPIGFTNSRYSGVKEKLDKAINGSSADTGWESLSGYYNKVSYGNLKIHATITDVYQTSERYDLRRGEAGKTEYKYFADALRYFDKTYDYSKFDNNGDGYIDCVYLVYLAPYMSSENQSDLWWAYVTEYLEDLRPGEEELRFDGVGLDFYMWLSYEFFSEDIYSDGFVSNDLGVKINCETIIHETGHALGLDDYYDYVNEESGGLGGLNMMDCNQGDHDPFSKAILGWIHPTVLRSDGYETELSSFTSTGDALFISKNGTETFFDEYYIVVFYTPDGVNALKAGLDTGIPDKSGVIVYHVSAGVKKDLTKVTLAMDLFAHNNGDKTEPLIAVSEADGDGSVRDGYAFDQSDMFFSFAGLKLSWYDGSSYGTLRVESVGESSARISVTRE